MDTPDAKLDAILRTISDAVTSAREKHPRFAGDFESAFRAVKSEHLEWEAQAMLVHRDGACIRINMKRLEKAESESYDCIVTQIRFLLREYPPFSAL